MAKQIKVREDNYFAVQGWMVTELKLKGNALMLYAIIYGFSQTTNTAFTGSVDYLCEWLGGVSRPTVINTLDNLVKQGLLTKSSTTKGALIYNSYTALRPSKKILSDEDPTSKKTLPDTSKNFLLNKDSKDNIEKSISKEMEGKAPKKKSYSTILEDPVNKFVKEALSKFIQYCRGKNYTPKVLEVPPTTVNGWMRGAHLPDIEKLMEICDYLEMPVGEMLGDHRHINYLDEVKHLMDVSLKQKAYIENLEAELNECKMLNNQLMSDLDADEGLAEICVNEFIADTIKAVKDAGVKKITVEF